MMPTAPSIAAYAAAHPPIDKPQPVLQPFQIRVIEEKQELDTRLERLGEFIAGASFKHIEALERSRLRRQMALMSELSTVLGARIAAFTPSPSQPA
jgi:hypothetical protein